MAGPLFLAAIVLAICVFFSSCGRKRDVDRAIPLGSLDASQFQPYDDARTVLDSVAADLNEDGLDEIILTSRDAFAPVNPLMTRQFDRVEMFSLDTSTGLYQSRFVDPVESGSGVSVRDITRNGKLEVIVSTDLGGNDPITSQGLSIYGFRSDGSLSILFFAQEGAPELRDLNADGIMEILVADEYRGLMSHAEGIGYIAEIHAFDGDTFVSSNRFFGQYFDHEIGLRKTDYARSKTARFKDEEEGMEHVYRAFVSWLLWTASKGEPDAVQRLWRVEKSFLTGRLSRPLLDDIDGLVQDILNAPQSTTDRKTESIQS